MWTLDKKATATFGYGTSSGVFDGCTTTSKKIAIICFGDNIQSPFRCITTGQTMYSLPISNTTSYIRYPFNSNNEWIANSWQGTSTQSFTNYGFKQVGCYNCYEKVVCSGGFSSVTNWIIPRINVTGITDNGTTATLAIKGTGDQKLPNTSTIKLFQEINGVWVQVGSTTNVPANTQSAPLALYPTANITIPTTQSNVPIHFKVSSETSGLDECWADMWLELKYQSEDEIPASTQPSAEFVNYGKAYCKIVNFKCIGRFDDVPQLENQANSMLVNILATNDNFFNSI